jgi:hypothetical protein
MQSILKVVGWVFVMLGVLLPLTLGFLWWQRPELCAFYLDHVKSYGALADDERRSLNGQLDAQIAVVATGAQPLRPLNAPKSHSPGTTLP